MILSIITSGKVDTYAGNFVQRITLNLTKLNDNCKKLGLSKDDVEIICVDWGSEDTNRLSDVLPELEFVKFLYVPIDVGKKYSDNFSIVHSLNAGYRRSSGRYIFFIDGDSYITCDSLKNIYEYFKDKQENAFYWGSRCFLPHDLYTNSDTFKELDLVVEEWLTHKSGWRFYDLRLYLPYNFSGGAMGMLLSRNICEESSLYYEVLNKWGWLDIEIHRRISQVYPCMGDLSFLDTNFFHLDHHSISNSHGQLYGANGPEMSPNFKANKDNWGLIDENLELYTNCNI